MRKKRTTKKKMSTGKKIAIGVAVAGGGYLAWEFLIKPMLDKNKDSEQPVTGNQYAQWQQENQIVDAVQQIPANSAPANNLSPIGTPFSQINYNAKIYFGNKGAEVKYIQAILNKASKTLNLTKETRGYTMPIVKEDGIFGKNTYTLLKAYFNESTMQSGITPKIAQLKYQSLMKDLPIETTAASFGSGIFSNVFGTLTN